MSGTSICKRFPACSATSTEVSDRLPISPAAFWLRSASFLTSEATTAKPLPCSPARAASIAAFSARRLVWRAISSMMDILDAISFMADTVLATAWPLSLASVADLTAIFSVCRELSAFCRMLEDICSIEELASSAEAACSLAPWDICSEVELSAWLPEVTLSAANFTSVTTWVRFCTMVERACIRPSFSERCFTSSIRFPSAISLASLVASLLASIRRFRLFLMSLKSP